MRGLSKQYLGRLGRRDFLKGDALIDGKWVSGKQRAAVTDPATGEEIADVACCDLNDVDAAIAAAERDFPGWQGLLPVKRGEVLRLWAAKMRQHSADLAVLMTCEQGKPLAEARYEIDYAAGFLDWFAAEGERTYGETIPSHKPASLLHSRLQPIGVAALVTPWNFPSAMITRKAGAALAAGCPVIAKPAPETPLSALAIARLALEAGVPAGAFQVLIGDAMPLSNRLLEDARVRAVSFTGSTDVGRLLLGKAARTVKKVSLELGGHAPFLLFQDAPLETAVSGAIAAKFATSGQDCLATNRIYVQRPLYDRFIDAFAEAIRRLKVGHGLESGTDIGPVTRQSVVQTCQAHIRDALSRGARLITGGAESNLGGRFVAPTLLADVTEEMLIARDETFGPVAGVLPFDSEEEVLRRANASEFGLAAYLYTNDLRRGLRISESLEYGMVGVNTASFTGAPVPFGGWKQSGLGREGGRYGINEYLESKYVCFGDLTAR